ncbi:MAG TPA: hypothetical protein ENN80_04600 [Candidatus Hydrogenedentes bacterium]|nr:hypothetical protein [Candidatus Hydrogenedentota bacterium]
MKHIAPVSKNIARAEDEEASELTGYILEGIGSLALFIVLIGGTLWGTKNWQNVADLIFNIVDGDGM